MHRPERLYDGGSPPRAWGQRGRHFRHHSANRFTPTRVGTTPPGRLPADARTVHPHARGDNHVVRASHHRGDGSPPRAWGQLRWRCHSSQASRFTPTRVGTTSGVPLPCPSPAVHPHARGDNANVTTRVRLTNGSPPRAWGQRRCRRHSAASRRFTPTRVGTTGGTQTNWDGCSVHPHARGDNQRIAAFCSIRAGSPPRAWGQQE